MNINVISVQCITRYTVGIQPGGGGGLPYETDRDARRKF